MCQNINYKKCFISIISIAVIYILYYLEWSDLGSRKNDKFIHGSEFKNNKKQILVWTTFFGSDDLTNLQCKSLNCIVTNNKALLSTSDAVIFHFSDINLTNIPNRTFPTQKFIYFTMEAPFSTSYYSTPKDYFNWLMSYNRKSDILFQYGSRWINVGDRNNTNTTHRLDNNYKNILSSKKYKGIVGFISNCETNSGREQVIDKLSKYIKIDIYGKCSNDSVKKVSCPSNDKECEKDLINSYYFYIAIENALCNDYVTEKYWSRYMYNSVPIVMRRDIYTDIGIPNSSLIAISDYQTSKDMVVHLNDLMNNSKKYLKYFEYRNNNNITVMNWDQFNLQNGVCALCDKLNDYRSILSQERIYDVSKLYTTINNCTNAKNAINFVKDW
uniref:Fucosyltransferase n=1 Tax=Strongyloides papillosus TaxID=174720 RepID=A0A0N5BDG4_STREA